MISWLKRDLRATFSLAFLLALGVLAVCAPLIAPYPVTAQDMDNTLAGPTAAHLLGTDDLGRDVLSRIIYGARISLLVGFTAAIASVFIGTVLGTLAGYFSGKPFRFYLGPLARAEGPR